MKKYLLLIDNLPFWSDMSRGKMESGEDEMFIVYSFLVQKTYLARLYTHVPKGRCSIRIRYLYISIKIAGLISCSLLRGRPCPRNLSRLSF